MSFPRSARCAAFAFAMLGCTAASGSERPADSDGGRRPNQDVETGGFGGHATIFREQPAHVEQRGDGALVVRRADRDAHRAALTIARDVMDGAEIDFGEGTLLRVREEGALGAPVADGAVATYRRRGGRSHWTVADRHAFGFEEWLEVEPGRAYADRILASWEVVGRSLREVEETGGVHVLGSDGEPIAYVTAPLAWSAEGDELQPTLSVERERIVLRVDADGVAVLVDPLWVPTGVLNEARCPGANGMVAIPGGALIAGGSDCTTTTPRSTAELYSSLTRVWSTAALSAPRGGHTTTRLQDGRVLIAGGYGGTSGRLSTAELYDPATGTWTGTGSMTTGRSDHTASLLPDGRVLVAGGYNGSRLATAELFDPSSGTWSTTGSMAIGRLDHRAVTLADGSVLVVGGPFPAPDAELYDPVTGAWRTVDGPGDLRYHGLTLLRDGRVLLTGGYRSGVSFSGQTWDPATELWSWTSRMSARRYTHTATVLSSGRVLVAGGSSSITGDPALQTSEIFDPVLGTFSDSDSMHVRRRTHAALLLDTGRVLVAGGTNQAGVTGTAELLDENVTCGDGVVGAGETCDDGNTIDGDCCSSRCRIEPAGTVCRRSGCTEATCTGGSSTCPPSVISPAGTLCRPALGSCDVAETCDGASSECPPDALAPSSTTCRPAVSECDAAEQCDGASAWCPTDLALAEGTACGPAPSGDCDATDVCVGLTGAWARCNEQFAAMGTTCRPAGGDCDVAEVCSGTSVECPIDVRVSAGTVCRAAVGDCDAPEACTGTSATCPPDARMAAGHVCRPAVGECDAAESCTGVGADCPTDLAIAEGTPCGPDVLGDCDVPDVCVGLTGSSASCEARLAPSGTACRDSACTGGVHTMAAACDGASPECPDGSTRSCGPFACGATECLDSCATDADCAAGHECVSAACVPRVDAGMDLDAGRELDGGIEPVDDGGGEPDAGGPGSSEAGCGCRVTSAGSGGVKPGIFGLALALLALRRRRPRRGGPRRRRGSGRSRRG